MESLLFGSLLTTSQAEEGVPQGIFVFLPAIPEMVWSAIVVALLAVVICKYAMPKLQAVLDKRVSAIDGNIKKAKESKAEAEKMLAAYNEKIRDVSQEAAKIREKARDDATRLVEEAKNNAQKQADHVINQASKAIEAERVQASMSLQNDIGKMATQLAEKIIGYSLQDEKLKYRSIDNFIKSINASVDNSNSKSSVDSNVK
jgi:F-type H+-transporting ATPase subunit b